MKLFDQAGEANTEETIKLAAQRARELWIKSCVVATTRGRTALAAAQLMSGLNLIAVTHCTGFVTPDFQELPADVRKELESRGVKVLTSTHAFGTLGRAVRRKFKTYEMEEIVANALRRFGEGTKVAVEIAMMAADAGLVSTSEDAVSIGGTGLGADTAIVLRPVNTHDFFDLKIREIICKPFDF